MLVKVLAVEGNRIRLSRKAILKEQRAKMGGGEAPPSWLRLACAGGAGDGYPASTGGTLVIEGGGDFPDEPGDNEPNFNRDGPPHVGAGGGGDRPPRRIEAEIVVAAGVLAVVVVDVDVAVADDMVAVVAVDATGGGGGGRR